MSQDPMLKNRVAKGPSDPIPRSQGPGTIDTRRDYGSAFSSLGSRIFFVCGCLLPYLGISLFVYFEGLAVLAIIMLMTPLVLFAFVWYLRKKLL